MSFRSWFKRNNLETQFWGYEGGNIVATIAGAGGPAAFVSDVSSTFQDQNLTVIEQVNSLAANYPDATVAIGLGATVLLAPIARKLANRSQIAINTVDVATSASAIGILGYALAQDSSWITVAASSFVVASSFLRNAKTNPFPLKVGGLGLAFGGVALAAFGMEGLQHSVMQPEIAKTTMDLLTIGTGVYVAGAGSLTYEGGIYETMGYKDAVTDENAPCTLAGMLLHPKKGSLSKLFTRCVDRPVQWFNRNIMKPSIVWVPKNIKERKPFATSMWARLPWRVMAGGAAIATGTPEGVAFAAANAGWAVGDVAIGSID